MIHNKIEKKKKTLSLSVSVLVSEFRVLTGYEHAVGNYTRGKQRFISPLLRGESF